MRSSWQLEPFGSSWSSWQLEPFGSSWQLEPFGSSWSSWQLEPFGSSWSSWQLEPFGSSWQLEPPGSSWQLEPFGSSWQLEPFGSSWQLEPFGSSWSSWQLEQFGSSWQLEIFFHFATGIFSGCQLENVPNYGSNGNVQLEKIFQLVNFQLEFRPGPVEGTGSSGGEEAVSIPLLGPTEGSHIRGELRQNEGVSCPKGPRLV